MPSSGEATVPATRRSRRSVGAPAEAKKTMDKENATVDVGSALAESRKKLRSKSMGPGGLDALKQGTGNRRASLAAPSKPPRSILKPAIASLPEIPPLKHKGKNALDLGASRVAKATPSPPTEESTVSKVSLRTEEEQQAAAREREELERRDARRKSLANRRVSFAAEATMHTFHEIEYMQDSTASTDSTRRASSVASTTPGRRESTPQEQVQNAPESPGDQRDLHQRKRRRSSGIQSASLHNPDEDTGTSTIYSSDSEPADAVEEIADDGEEASSSDSDDGTMVSITTDDITGTSVGSERSASGDASSTLDEALRLAAHRADSQKGPGDKDDDDLDDGEEVIPSFGWVKKGNNQGPTNQDENSTQMDMDMDMTGGIIKPAELEQPEDGEDMSMDVTRVYGGIVPAGEDDDATMELTKVVGGIYHPQDQDLDDVEDNEDMSMELTTVIGGVLSQQKRKSIGVSRRRTVNNQQEADGEDSTMDMTAAIGGIIQDGAGLRALGKKIMEEEVDKPNSPKKAIMAAVLKASPQKLPQPAVKAADETISPGLSAFRGKGLRRSAGPQASGAIDSGSISRTPSPAKPTTPQRGTTSSRSQNARSPSASPRRPSAVKTKTATPSPAKTAQKKPSVFQNDPATGSRTPTVVLTPQRRRLSGVGADRTGLGSPRVSAAFDRRTSIGEAATEFVPGTARVVSFQDPREMAEQVDKQRQLDEDRENRRKILEREADGSLEDRDATLNLREMIDSLSPKRKPLIGRKSLHVGSASGLLGKRPVELDSDEEEEENDGVKRLKGHQGSPVKNVRLQQPPSKAETTGRISRLSRKSLEQGGSSATPTLSSPSKAGGATTPKNQARFKDVEDDEATHEINFSGSPAKDAAQLESEIDDGRIHLQDFLNMTSIRFMELTTTKRRHTMAPGTLQDGTLGDGQDDLSLERCVVAGACTVPTLELYQHSCRELKKYISEGRRIIREIEADTSEDNPPLFREYMSAAPEVKALMDHQFKNVKTHARLLSKAMWYEWRMKLQDGLKEGLISIGRGMEGDAALLHKQEELVASVLPAVEKRYEDLTSECANLEEAAQELADSDPKELQGAREELTALDEDIAQKKKLIADLRKEFEAAEEDVEALSSQKQECLADIKESEKTREECRGWTSTEVNALKARVDAIEQKHGWAVTGLAGTTLSMAYRREIELVFDTASFQPGQANSRIDLWYIGDNRESNAVPKTAEKEFFLQCIRDHVRELSQSSTAVTELLRIVRQGWDMAGLVSGRIERVNIIFPTTVAKTSDSSVAVTTSLLLVPLETRVEVNLNLRARRGPAGVGVAISPEARVVYGENFNATKVGDFLATRICDSVGAKDDDKEEEEWSDVLVELHERLIARGKK